MADLIIDARTLRYFQCQYCDSTVMMTAEEWSTHMITHDPYDIEEEP